MKTKLTDYLPLAAIAAGAFLLTKKQSVSGVGRSEEFSAVGRIVRLYDKRYSANGNPSFKIEFITNDGRTVIGRTEANSLLGYKLGDYYVNRPVRVFYHITPNIRIIFTGVEELDF